MQKNLNADKIKKMVLPVLKPYGVKRAGLFGSVARGEAKAKSDIDLLLELNKNLSLLDVAALKLKLEDVLGATVDIVEYKSIKPRLKKYILKDYIPFI